MSELEIKTIIPNDKDHWLDLRSANINSTEIAALFGLSPYLTKFELWHRKKGNVVADFQANERTLWGNRLEAAIAEASAEEQGWKIRKAPEYVSRPQERLGSSFDYIIQELDPCLPVYGVTETYVVGQLVDTEILEIKNVDSLVFKEGWLTDDDGNLEAPPHIELQVQQQMYLKPMVKRTRIRALVGGNKMVEIVRERNQEMIDMIIAEAAAFWKSIDDNIPPHPDFSADLDTLKRLYETAEPGKIFDATGNDKVKDLAETHAALGKNLKSLEETRDSIKAELLTLIGDAEKVVGEGFSISCGTVGPAQIEAYTRKPFRSFRVFTKKAKA